MPSTATYVTIHNQIVHFLESCTVVLATTLHPAGRLALATADCPCVPAMKMPRYPVQWYYLCADAETLDLAGCLASTLVGCVISTLAALV